MKNKIFLILLFISINMATAQECAIENEIQPRIKDATISFPWIHRGKIIYYYFQSEKTRFKTYVYQIDNDASVALSNRIDSLNKVIKYEIHESDEDAFIKKHLRFFVLDMMTHGAYEVITKDSIVDGKTSDEKIMMNYILDPSPAIVAGKWSMRFNLVTEWGAIEQWRLQGQLRPLKIISFTRKILKPDGTMGPISLIK